MKIVMATPFGLRPRGTASVRALPLGQALAARGHQVTLLVPSWDDRASSGQSFEQGGVQVAHLHVPNRAAFDVPLLTLRLLRAARAEKPDVLHLFKPKAYTAFLGLLWRAARRVDTSRAPIVMDTDDWEGPGGWNDLSGYTPLQKRLFAWQEQWELRHSDAVTVASRTLESIVLSMGVPPSRLAYLPNGPGIAPAPPDPTEVESLHKTLGLPTGAPVALLFTRFWEFDEAQLARRWARVVAELPEARLLVVGKGLHGEEVRFRAELETLGVSNSVSDVGFQPLERLRAYFALARVALYPMSDTLVNRAKCPVKLADYMQAGLPVVGEAVGQVAEYLAGDVGGLLVPSGDDAAFVSATLRLLRDPEFAAIMGRAGQQRLATRFDWPIQAERAEALYGSTPRR
jgi:glycosyltransferase involved in cell wall biosynthesis